MLGEHVDKTLGAIYPSKHQCELFRLAKRLLCANSVIRYPICQDVVCKSPVCIVAGPKIRGSPTLECLTGTSSSLRNLRTFETPSQPQCSAVCCYTPSHLLIIFECAVGVCGEFWRPQLQGFAHGDFWVVSLGTLEAPGHHQSFTAFVC